MTGAAKFEEHHYVSAHLRDNAEARVLGWARARDEMFRALQKHYGPRFPDAMMRIQAWIETEEIGGRGEDYPAHWAAYRDEDRPLLLRLRVTVRG